MKTPLRFEKNELYRALMRSPVPQRPRVAADWPASFLIGALLGAAMLLVGSLWWF